MLEARTRLGSLVRVFVCLVLDGAYRPQLGDSARNNSRAPATNIGAPAPRIL